MTAWTPQPGEQVAIWDHWTIATVRLATVERLTPTQVILAGIAARWRRSNLREMGDGRSKLRAATDPRVRKVLIRQQLKEITSGLCTRTIDSCPFCRILDGDTPTTMVRRWCGVFAIEPLNPVTPGHLLVIPVEHVADATVNPSLTSHVMHAAAELAREVGDCNIITSVGSAATQTVFHLHVHVVPRRVGDGLALPWTGQRTEG